MLGYKNGAIGCQTDLIPRPEITREKEQAIQCEIHPVHDTEQPVQIDPTVLAAAIEVAYATTREDVIRTPTVRLPWLDAPGRIVWAKLESQQHSGSFKYRGALNALRQSPFRSVVTASAGNHALATAAVGYRLGKNVEIITPTTASEIKIGRLVRNSKVTVFGRDLYEATTAAIELARLSPKDAEHGLCYLSPYANFDVAAGAGTMMLEATEDAGFFDSVIVPLGGGGLTAAVGAWCSVKSPFTKIICTHPKVFGRHFNPENSISHQLLQPTEASYSDGLGVQLIEKTPFANILDSTISEVVQVSESVTAAAIAYLLRLQSLLVEGAAATTIGALMGDPEGRKYQGNVLLLLTGGNVASHVVAKALVADVPDPQVRQKLGLRHIVDPVERHGALKIYHKKDQKQESKAMPIAEVWQSLFLSLRHSTQTLHDNFCQKEALAQHLALEKDSWCGSVFMGMHKQLFQLLNEVEMTLQCADGTGIASWQLEDRYRVLLQLQSALEFLFERASASYDQSRRDWFFDTSAQNASAVNYDRYGVGGIRSFEVRLLDTLRLGSKEPIDLLLTSSGMAAYQVLQLFLLQNLQVGDTIVLPPYIYFEALEQLQSFPHVRIEHAPDFTAEKIIETAEKYNARAVFVDPVANIVGLPTTDIQRFGQLASSRPGWADRFLILDGTMVSGGMGVYDWLQGAHKPTLLYYESASKYLQLGLDMQMGGLLVYPSKLDEAMRTIRRNSGTIMYSRNVSLLPPINHEIFQARMSVLTNNAEILASAIKGPLRSVAEVCFPTEWRQFGWRHGGALVTIRFHREGMNNKEGLEACIDLTLRIADKLQTPVTKGVSFGFSTPRISSASSMAKDSDPFLRISIGMDVNHINLVAKAVIDGVLRYCIEFGGDQAG